MSGDQHVNYKQIKGSNEAISYITSDDVWVLQISFRPMILPIDGVMWCCLLDWMMANTKYVVQILWHVLLLLSFNKNANFALVFIIFVGFLGMWFLRLAKFTVHQLGLI